LSGFLSLSPFDRTQKSPFENNTIVLVSRLARDLRIRHHDSFIAAQALDMDNTTEIKQNIRKLMVENLMLQISPEEIGDDQPLFGPGSVGLDSVDALQLVVALDKAYGLKVSDPEAAKKILQNVNSIADAVAKHQAAK